LSKNNSFLGVQHIFEPYCPLVHASSLASDIQTQIQLRIVIYSTLLSNLFSHALFLFIYYYFQRSNHYYTDVPIWIMGFWKDMWSTFHKILPCKQSKCKTDMFKQFFD
jgi:hypothetical protein